MGQAITPLISSIANAAGQIGLQPGADPYGGSMPSIMQELPRSVYGGYGGSRYGNYGTPSYMDERGGYGGYDGVVAVRPGTGAGYGGGGGGYGSQRPPYVDAYGRASWINPATGDYGPMGSGEHGSGYGGGMSSFVGPGTYGGYGGGGYRGGYGVAGPESINPNIAAMLRAVLGGSAGPGAGYGGGWGGGGMTTQELKPWQGGYARQWLGGGYGGGNWPQEPQRQPGGWGGGAGYDRRYMRPWRETGGGYGVNIAPGMAGSSVSWTNPSGQSGFTQIANTGSTVGEKPGVSSVLTEPSLGLTEEGRIPQQPVGPVGAGAYDLARLGITGVKPSKQTYLSPYDKARLHGKGDLW